MEAGVRGPMIATNKVVHRGFQLVIVRPIVRHHVAVLGRLYCSQHGYKATPALINDINLLALMIQSLTISNGITFTRWYSMSTVVSHVLDSGSYVVQHFRFSQSTTI
jgi:hypothetical protein